MNQKEVKQLIDNPILRAYAEGKTIHYKQYPDADWEPATEIDLGIFQTYPERYRIKPEPRTFWVLIYGDKSRTFFEDEGIAQSYKEQTDKRYIAEGKSCRAEIIKVVEAL